MNFTQMGKYTKILQSSTLLAKEKMFLQIVGSKLTIWAVCQPLAE